MPSSTWPFLNHSGVLAFAHRGGAGEWPENTMPAFENAVSLGYKYVETDVHLTSDGVLVACHDESLDRVTDRTGLIREMKWVDVRQARVDGIEPIPLLEDLLGTWPDLHINIDPKHDSSVEALAQVLIRTNSVERVCVGAFSDKRLARLRKLVGPLLCTSLGPGGTARLKASSKGLPIGVNPGACAQVPHRSGKLTITDKRFVDKAHSRGLQVHVWTIDDPDEMNYLLDLGVDGIMTDKPAILREVLQSRNMWV